MAINDLFSGLETDRKDPALRINKRKSTDREGVYFSISHFLM